MPEDEPLRGGKVPDCCAELNKMTLRNYKSACIVCGEMLGEGETIHDRCEARLPAVVDYYLNRAKM